jgi:hypothetical protein
VSYRFLFHVVHVSITEGLFGLFLRIYETVENGSELGEELGEGVDCCVGGNIGDKHRELF